MERYVQKDLTGPTFLEMSGFRVNQALMLIGESLLTMSGFRTFDELHTCCDQKQGHSDLKNDLNP